jgi:hypothetical protein
MEGVNGFLVAADVSGVEHFTEYPSNKATAAFQIPFKDGKIPEYVILRNGACRSRTQVVGDGEAREWEDGGEL